MKGYSPPAAKQRGMAIISALLIAAVVAVLAGAMLTRQTVFTRSLEAEQLRIQGQWLLQGGLERSRQMLWDARQKEVLTRLDQPWARALGGAFEGRIEDEQGKFNLRNLVNRQQVDSEQLQSFERLCQLIGVDPAVSRRVSQRVIASYLPPVKYPMLRSLDDLSGLEGLDPLVLQRMQAYISVLPGPTWVNGNTASAEVLSAVVPQLSLSQAHGLVAERDSGQWFINRGDFVNRLHLPEVVMDSVQVGITSEWFRLQGQARREQRRVTIDALLHRPEDRQPRVIWSRVGV
ncbi:MULTISPECIES: type II secretion system minor pseudopilin GspK [Pseudomonas fluorescens group]|uniref:Type II secretion system protein K n=1 Tax=Pseudomonas petroselini TaxID=2899822 RepID=A0ABS8R3G5_9PSED|nr:MULTISPECIES: type II secretion system minor pseudopilin GspK [Pseudomonas fluorescens group]MCD7042522.1 type II secretion system minor pseudopilin GspK [Pseudomonas petroselini]MCD7042939.1 type II secretion system minor pseudopilin GspK [Pseudomonas petroselini]MCD7068920.1 type II secretion system minor pseudopilin GspK [Pseudomonas petroselini]MCD7083109.1 type II secretion system minor pseudopilin GspK [Pseudomonas petroselini]